MSISKRLRYEILSRDGFACVYCGSDSTQLHVDHVVPQALGGTDDSTNLATACADCNLGKASSAPTADKMAAVDERNAEWRQRVADALFQVVADEGERSATIDLLGLEWDSWHYTDRAGVKRPLPKAPGWRHSLRMMLDRGMTHGALSICITIAMEADVEDEWSYFCGVVWRTLRRAQGQEG
jgi:hypothetical protein